MAQRHSDWSVFSDQYFHHPAEDWKGKNDEEQIHHYYLSCVPIQSRWQAANLHSVYSACSKFSHRSTGTFRFWEEACYLTCYRQVLLYWPIFNAIIPELFIGPAPLWCISFPTSRPSLISLSFHCFFLYGALMYFASRLTQLFPKIWTSNHCVFLFMWAHICSSFLWSPYIPQVYSHMFSATTRSLMV